MIYCLNNLLGFSNKYDLTYRQVMDHIKYPLQDFNKIGKVIHLKFKDEKQQIIRNRLNINKNKFPQFTEENTYDDWYFKIIRYDSEFPYTVILVDKDNRVIVTDTTKINNLYVHPGYEYRGIDGFEELKVDTKNWKDFNHAYKRDFIHQYPIQRDDYIGLPIYIEYYLDLFNLKKSDQLKEIDLSDRKPDIEKIREELIEVNPDLDVFDNSFLIRYPSYYNQHLKSLVDVPLRVVHKGFIIRVDISSCDCVMVAIQINEDGSCRYITDREATFYYDEKSDKLSLEELDLWQR